MKIVGVTTCGGFKAWWLQHGLASIYNLIDEMIIAVGGPGREQDYLKPMLKEVDIKEKVSYIYPAWKDAPPYLNPGRDDVRALNKTMAVQEAYKRGADWILPFDCDMVYYESLGPVVRELIQKDINSYRFTMITLSPDIYHTDFLMPWDQNPAMAESQYSYLSLFKAYTDLYYVGCAHIGTDRAQVHFPQKTDRRVVIAHLWAITPDIRDRINFLWEKFYWSAYVSQQGFYTSEQKLNDQQLAEYAIERVRQRLNADTLSPPNGRIPLGSIDDPRVPKAPPLVLQKPYFDNPVEYIEKGLPYI